MTNDVVITLIGQAIATDPDINGETVITPTRTDVFAQIKSVKRAEFYQGAAAGLKPEIVFECYEFEYGGEKIIEYNDCEYNVIRTYPICGERMEIICNNIARID